MFERKLLVRDDIPSEFFESRNVWNRYAECRFHHSLERSGIEVVARSGTKVSDIDWIKSQLGGYNWELVNMHLSQDHKIAMCAYFFSQVFEVTKMPNNLHEGPYIPPKPKSKEDWLAEIKASAEKDRIEEETRKEKIKSGEITLPDKTRPYEIWIKDSANTYYRFKTARSREALALSATHAQLRPGSYLTAYCSTDHEDSRNFLD